MFFKGEGMFKDSKNMQLSDIESYMVSTVFLNMFMFYRVCKWLSKYKSCFNSPTQLSSSNNCSITTLEYTDWNSVATLHFTCP